MLSVCSWASQVLTGESWASAVARPLVDESPGSAIFFISYILVCNIMLMNVVIAILLENMNKVHTEDKQEHDADARREAGDPGTGDPELPPSANQIMLDLLEEFDQVADQQRSFIHVRARRMLLVVCDERPKIKLTPCVW